MVGLLGMARTEGCAAGTRAMSVARPRRILVVDDVRYVRELLRLHLAGAGYEVELAEDGIQAAHAMLQNPPDLVVCDLHMPYMSGLEFLCAMRVERSVAAIPVVILTAHADSRDAAFAAGATDFLLKPIRSDVLLATLARHLAGPAQPGAE